jgi:hypothetical protein
MCKWTKTQRKEAGLADAFELEIRRKAKIAIRRAFGSVRAEKG